MSVGARRRRGPRRGTPEAPLSAARRRVLDAVARLGAVAGPVTLAAVADELGGHPNTSRQHLDALVADGHLEVVRLARPSRGRPPLAYAVTERGRRGLEGGPVASEMRDIVGAFATYLVRGGRTDEAQEVGRVWAERAGAAVAEDSGVSGLVEVLDALGFDPSPVRAEGGRDALVLRSCPLLDLADDHPEVICQLHRGMVDGVLRRVGAAEGVRLEPFALEDGCLIAPESA